jgi:hypothetical protein
MYFIGKVGFLAFFVFSSVLTVFAFLGCPPQRHIGGIFDHFSTLPLLREIVVFIGTKMVITGSAVSLGWGSL